jgi:hypothetical protein
MRLVHSEYHQVGSPAWRCLPEALSGSEWGRAEEAQTLTSHLPRTYNETRLILVVLQLIEGSGFLEEEEKLSSSFCTACQPSR